ncbi:MAG: ABC transporter permease [Bacteroidales bacterium]|nr:ABC transporter permease [Bacteroidales bacterium]
MFKNFLKIALRGIVKNRFYSFITVLCLITGLTTFLVLMNYIYFEKSYDTFNKDAKNIYRLIYKTYKGEELYQNWASSVFKLGPAVKDNFSEVVDYVRIRHPQINAGEHVVSYKDMKYREDLLYFVDPSFFNVFSYKLKRGNPETALSQVKSVVLTESLARKYFGDEDPMNKMLKFTHKSGVFSCIVTGIMEDIPANSHLKFDLLVSMETYFLEHNRNLDDNWVVSNFYTYVKLKDGTSISSLKKRLDVLVDQNSPIWKKKTYKITFDFQPLLDIHLKSDSYWEEAQTGSRMSLYFLLILSICILLISWVNFINFSTSRVIEKAKEVAIRKIMGSSKTQQITQFLIESFVFNLTSVVVSLLLSFAFIPFLNSLTGKNINFYLFSNADFFLMFIGIVVIGTLLISLYPIFMISSFTPATVLKGRQSFGHSKTGGVLRKILVIFQFIIALCIIIGTFTIFLQIRYMKKQDLGFDKDGIIVIRAPIISRDSTYVKKFKTFKAECERSANVDKLTISSDIPGKNLGLNLYLLPANSTDNNSGAAIMLIYIDADFFDVYKVKLLEGRNFLKNFVSDSTCLILNEAAVKELGFINTEDAFKQLLRVTNGNNPNLKVVGVTKNYRQESLKNDYTPTAFFQNFGYATPHFISVRINKGNTEETISFIKQKWETYFPETPIDYYFMDNFFDMQYADDYRFIKIFTILLVISILLSCMGILGLTYLDTSKRTKEIGIRKVMGASMEKILVVLLTDIMKLIIVATIIGWPIAYFAMNKWLQNYTNRISMPWFAFVVGGVALLVITMLTVSYHTIQAASQNPVNSLKEE